MSLEIKMPQLQIGDLTAKVPIVQGGMGIGVSMSNLAAAVANEGGIGVISASGVGLYETDFNSNFTEANRRALRQELKKARQMTKGVIGVNIMVAFKDCLDLIKTAVEEFVDVIFIGAGLPLNIPDSLIPNKLNNIKTKIVPIVSSGKAANLIFRYWQSHFNRVPDAVVVEGPLAGGHLGFKTEQIDDPKYCLENLVSDVIAEVKPYESFANTAIPVIAAGGIYTGADIHRFISSGAQGVQMATRFVATHECDASKDFKETYIKCKMGDLKIIKSPAGLPGRAIKNKFLEDVELGKKVPSKCRWRCLTTCTFQNSPYCICDALVNAQKGNFNDGYAFAGANAYRIDSIMSVKELMATLVEEYEQAAANNKAAL